MKKALVYLASFYPNEDAITNAVIPLLEKMKEEYQVDIYAKSQNGQNQINEEIKDYHVYRDKYIGQSKTRRLKWKIAEIRNLNLQITSSKNYFLKKMVVNFLNLLNDSLFTKLLHIGEKEKWYQPFSEVASKGYDLVLTINSPIVSHYEGLKLYKKGYFKNRIWIAYYVDTFATYIRNTMHPDFQKFLQFETDIYHYADAIITTEEIKNDNQKYPMGQYRNKVFTIPFATLKFEPSIEKPTGKLKCVYTGSLFDHTVRKPDYFFKLCNQFPTDIEVTIVCNLTNPIVEKLKTTYLDGKENIKWYGRKSIEECFALMNQADVLVNFGNESSNQTPSKVFDYIGRCKHILNFYSIDQDTSKYYLKEYPYALNIKNKEQIEQEDFNQMISFIRNSRNETIDVEKIKKMYQYLSAEEISKKFMDTLRHVEKKVKSIV